jgi:hypothetical protein
MEAIEFRRMRLLFSGGFHLSLDDLLPQLVGQHRDGRFIHHGRIVAQFYV